MARAVVFVDTEEEAESFDPAAHFNTAPELVDRHFNRPTTEQLSGGKLITKKISRKQMNRIESAKASAYTELLERSGREKKLKGWMQDMEMASQLAGKGKKKKLKNGKNGRLPTYKWSTVRKK